MGTPVNASSLAGTVMSMRLESGKELPVVEVVRGEGEGEGEGREEQEVLAYVVGHMKKEIFMVLTEMVEGMY